MRTGTFQKKPIQIEAIQLVDPIDWNQLTEFLGSKSEDGAWQAFGQTVNILNVGIASPGDWIARDERGEYHVLTNENMEKLYEEMGA